MIYAIITLVIWALLVAYEVEFVKRTAEDLPSESAHSILPPELTEVRRALTDSSPLAMLVSERRKKVYSGLIWCKRLAFLAAFVAIGYLQLLK
ncbi:MULTISPECIES: hypothetical protein [Pseudoalteromonas]|uniref:Uncharacterized protein n=1 Tax=Pseudoalteromonas luteoviolacea (strain 2ta16) TaxID=1353533 RepID=V4HIH9_PSEL2|nr:MULTISPECIES: hypothetical protein [Pseudoalteromonas]ESP90600.1 hypothetical protein PL2TA16_01704 [Pseudoalteromonas luteoviolacea 2ta16]KZN41827.1 hypothetical protein N483_14240 [Pseudoalteromonas luteoviolacea NCIMB 1944]MCG7550426.1 hypothetical protein [Pseudoalteromonas sp. Of7M-16]